MRADRPGCEITRPDQDRTVLIAILRRAEPERLPGHDRTARGGRELLPIERRLLSGAAIVGCRESSPAAVAQEERRRAAQLIAAGLCHDVDCRRRRTARFRREAVGGDLELLHRLLRDVLQRPADDIVVVVRAVHHDVAASPELAGRRDGHRVRFGRVEIRRRRVPRHEQGQLQEVAAVQRQRFDELCRDDRVHDRPAGVENADRPVHDDRLADLLNGQFDDERRGLPYLDHHPGPPRFPEPWCGHRDVDGGGRHIGYHERTVRIGGRAAGQRCPARHHFYDGRRHSAALRVANRSSDGTRGPLTTGLDCERNSKCDAHSNTTDTNHVPTPGWTGGPVRFLCRWQGLPLSRDGGIRVCVRPGRLKG